LELVGLLVTLNAALAYAGLGRPAAAEDLYDSSATTVVMRGF
jgi:hypothetical protein